MESGGYLRWRTCGEEIRLCNAFFLSFEPWLTQIRPYEVRGTSRRGQRRSQKPFLGAAIEGFKGGDATNPSFCSIEPHRMLGTSCRASRVVEKAQVLSICKASVLFGAQVTRGRRPTSARAGSNPRAHQGARRWNAPRSSWNASPFAGRCGNRRSKR